MSLTLYYKWAKGTMEQGIDFKSGTTVTPVGKHKTPYKYTTFSTEPDLCLPTTLIPP
jgi:hypothetical protein